MNKVYTNARINRQVAKIQLLHTLRNTLNKMLSSIDDATSRILRVVNSYTNDDFTDYIRVVDNYKDDMKLLMESINILGKELGNSAKNNL